MIKAFVDVFLWGAIVAGLALAVLIVQTVMAHLHHDINVPYSYIRRLVTGLFG